MTRQTSNDTHVMALGERDAMCTRCPTPCESCRGGQGPYCATTPCLCSCHVPAPAQLREDIELSRRASAGMPAELAAPHVALADLGLAYFAALDAADACELTEEALTAAGELLDTAERQLRAALGLPHQLDGIDHHAERVQQMSRRVSELEAERDAATPAVEALSCEVGADHTPPSGWQERVLSEVARDTVTLTLDRTELDSRLAGIERTLIRAGHVADAHRCAIARDPAHPHSAGEAAALLLGLPSPYPDRAAGDRSLTIGGDQ